MATTVQRLASGGPPPPSGPRRRRVREGVAGRVDLLAYLPFAAVLVAFFGIPLVYIVQFAVADPDVWSTLFARPGTRQTIVRTLAVAGQVTLICAVVGYLYVGALRKVGARLRAVLLAAVLVPFLTSILVRSYAWLIVLNEQGPIADALRFFLPGDQVPSLVYNRTGVLIGMVHVMLPMFVLPLYAVMSQLNPELEKAARSLGADRVTTFVRVILPLSAPGAIAGALLVFIQSLGFFITPALVGGPNDTMIAQLIERQISGLTVDINAAAVLSVVLVFVVVLLILIFRLFYPIETLLVASLAAARKGSDRAKGARSGRGAGGSGRLTRSRDAALRGVSRALSAVPWGTLSVVIASVTVVYLLLPMLIVIPVSFTDTAFIQFPPHGFSLRWYEEIVTSIGWLNAAKNSLIVGGSATVLTLLIGLPLAFALVRSQVRDKVKGLVILILMLPALLPVVVLAIGAFVFFLKVHLVGNRFALAGVYVTLCLPYVTVIAVAALRDFDIRVEQAARSLGAGRLRTLTAVTLPLLKGALASGALFTFLIALDELLISSAVTNPTQQTLAIRIWQGANEQLSPALASYSTLSLLLTVGLAVLLGGIRGGRARMRRR